MKAKNIFLLGIGVAVLAGSLVLTGVLYFKLKEFNKNKEIVTKEENVFVPETDLETEISPVTDNEEAGIVKAASLKDYSDIIKDKKLEVEWYMGAIPVSEKETDEIIAKKFPDYLKMKEETNKINKSCEEKNPEACWYIENPNIFLYKIGKIKNFNDSDLYYVYIPQLFKPGMGDTTTVVMGFYDKSSESFVLIFNPKASGSPLSTLFEPASGVNYGFTSGQGNGVDDTEYLKELANKYPEFSIFEGFFEYTFKNLPVEPSVIDVPNSDAKLVNIENTDYIFSNVGDYGNSGILNYAQREVITNTFLKSPVVFKTSDGLDVRFNGSCYFIVEYNGTVVRYNLVPGFMSWENKASKIYYGNYFDTKIKWNNGEENIDTYLSSGDFQSRGCGGPSLMECTSIIGNKDWFDENKLIQTGTAVNGEKIFEFTNALDNEFYKNIFYKVFLPDENTQFFADFVKDHPLIFWKDYAGNWRVFQKTKYLPQAECGKPVIYLYPEKEMDVKVEVKPNGGFSKTEPMYDNGWLVRATPQSDLFNYTDRQNYPYLFWEGKAYNYVTPNYGFVIAKKDVGIKMTQILSKLGLNEKETKDFLEFWQPKLEVSPYVFVTFLPQTEFDKLAPLTVNPKPTTVIRVFMDYTPLEKPVEVAPMYIKTPIRNGFTVVEWGGRLK